MMMDSGGISNTFVGTFKRRRSSITQQLLSYQDMLTSIFMKRSSRSSFSSSSDGNESTTDLRSDELSEILVVEENRKHTQRKHSIISLPSTGSDLIQLKSPNNSNAETRPLSGSVTVPTRRRSAEVSSSSSPYYVEHDRIHQLSQGDRLSTIVTPTATSFSREDLNEIFNISRDTMDPVKSPLKSKETTVNDSVEISQSPDRHNVAIDESNFSFENTLTEELLAAQSMTELNESMTELNDNNNNNKDNNGDKDQQLSLDVLNRPIPKTPSSDSITPTMPKGNGGTASMSKLQMVCREMFMTEKTYVSDLQDIIEGYIYHLKQKGDLDVESIFGNLEDIFEFNKEVLYQIEQCETENFEIDPIRLAKVFIEKARGFNNHYTHYCTNYPEASHFFSIIMQDPGIAAFFLERQKVVGHVLSLESFLLKPVQRIMKYNLLFRDILKRYEGDKEGYDIINTANLAMTDVAEYINEMKRLHENAVKVQEILNNVIYIDVPIDVYATGRLVLENSFKVQGVRGERIMYLFEKLLLICKKREDCLFQFKEKIECCNMMLVESIAKDPLGFQIMRFDNRKVNHTIIAKSAEIKKEWVKELKRLILENHAAVIPQTARQAILGPEEKSKSKYNSLQFQALDDSVMTNVRNLNKKTGLRNQMNKESNLVPSPGSKRESNEKETFSPKRPLNSKAKEFLHDKKGNRLTQSGSSILSQGGEKEKKEKLPKWMKRHHKQKNSLDGNVSLDSSTDVSTENLFIPPVGIVKSRSLESLKDALKDQEQYKEEVKAGTNILKDIINYNFEQFVDDAIEDIQPMQTTDSLAVETGLHILSRPTSSILTNIEINQPPPKNIEQLEKPDPDQKIPQHPKQFTSGIRITKSNSLSLRKKGGSVDDMLFKRQKRWSTIPNDPSRLEKLEHRLSLLGDDTDDTSITSIKNMVRKVSNAFNSSYQTAYEDSPRSHITGDCDVSRDLGELLSATLNNKESISRTSETIDNTMKENEEGRRDEDPNNEHETCIDIDIGEAKSNNDSNEDLSKHWSTDVDQVFDEVNADLDRIADSIASDSARSDSESQVGPTYEVTSVGMDIAHRAAIVDMRLQEANNVDTMLSPVSTKRVNVEVKRVADRIKEYKRLVDAEKRRTSWRRREPKSMNEMMESLETIKSTENGLTPTYQSMRRRYRSSRDFEGTSLMSSTDASPRSSCSSIKRSLSENFTSALESNSRNESESLAATPTQEITFTPSCEQLSQTDTIKTLTDSIKTLNNKKDKNLDSAEDINVRTDRYKKALENFDTRVKPDILFEGRTRSEVFDARSRLASMGEFQNEQTVIVRRRLKTTATANVVCRNSGDWTRKAQTLPHPKRSGAIKRIVRADSESNEDTEQEVSPISSEIIKDLSSSSNTSSNETKNILQDEINSTKKIVVNRKTHHRSTSLPRQKKRQINKTIHEEVSSKYVTSNKSKLNLKNQPNINDIDNENETSNFPRGRSTKLEKCDKTLNSHRSVSLPRRAPGMSRRNLKENQNKNSGTDNEEEKSSSITISRSPSIRCIQSNHVNNRIKDYFVNLQKSSEISRSRPNLVVIGNSCSDSDCETSSSDDRISNDETNNITNNINNNNNNKNNNINNINQPADKEQILKGTVASMIQRYGKQNYVFDL